ncbi:MAG: DUF6642 family protein [Bacteroidota bacterium]
MKKGIYCLEGLWTDDLQNKSTVLPILELLHKGSICNYIYHACATREELEFFLKKWKKKSIITKYPILYLAFHGKRGHIYITSKNTLSLNDLAEVLENSAQGKVIFFASCETLNAGGRTIQSFLKKTNAIAAIGYKQEVDWMIATAFELLVLDALQQDRFDSRGIEKIETKIKTEYGNLYQLLDCRMVINKYIYFPRKRTAPRIKP